MSSSETKEIDVEKTNDVEKPVVYFTKRNTSIVRGFNLTGISVISVQMIL